MIRHQLSFRPMRNNQTWNRLHSQVAAVSDMQSSQIITNYRLSEKQNIFAGEMYTICVEWADDYFGPGLT